MTASASALLAVDASGPGCSVALWHDGGVRAVRRVALQRGHAAALMPLVRDTMADAELGWAAVAAVAVTVGPGSFTGIRVGLAAARGLGLALGVPVLGATSFEAVAWGVPALVRAAGGLVVLIDSGRGSRFVQAFDAALQPCGPPVSVELARLRDVLPPPPCTVIAVGTPPAGCVGARPIVVATPDAAALAALAAARRAAGGAFAPAAPLYLRPPDAAVPPAGGRIRA